MQILINIPEEKYELYKRWKPSERSMLQEAVANGTPLPEPHGNLVDENEVIACIDNRIQFLTKNHPQFVRKCGHIDMVGCIGKIREEVHKIIPATKGADT